MLFKIMTRPKIDSFTTAFALVFLTTICCAAPLEMANSPDSSASEQQGDHPCSPIEEGDHLPKSSTTGVWTRFEGPSADVTTCLGSFIENVLLCSSEATSSLALSESRNITVDFLNDDHPVDWAAGPCQSLVSFATCFERKVAMEKLDFSACVEENALNMTALAERHCGQQRNSDNGSETPKSSSSSNSETIDRQSAISVGI